MRKLLCFALCIIILITSIPTVFAAQGNDIMPMFDNINSVYASIEINQTNGLAKCTGMVAAKSTYPVSVTVHLQQNVNNSWVTLQTWRASGTWSATATNYYAVYSGYQYRVMVFGYVYDDAGRIIETGSSVHSVNYPKK